MAPQVCSFCDTEYAVLMVTVVADGDTKAVGAACIPGYALSMAAGVTGGLSASDCAQLGELFDQIAARDKRPKPKRAAGRSSGTQTQTSTERATGAESGTSGQEDSPAPNGSDTPNGDSQIQHPASGDYDGMHQADESDTG